METYLIKGNKIQIDKERRILVVDISELRVLRNKDKFLFNFCIDDFPKSSIPVQQSSIVVVYDNDEFKIIKNRYPTFLIKDVNKILNMIMTNRGIIEVYNYRDLTLLELENLFK